MTSMQIHYCASFHWTFSWYHWLNIFIWIFFYLFYFENSKFLTRIEDLQFWQRSKWAKAFISTLFYFLSFHFILFYFLFKIFFFLYFKIKGCMPIHSTLDYIVKVCKHKRFSDREWGRETVNWGVGRRGLFDLICLVCVYLFR